MVINAEKKGVEEDRFRLGRVVDPSICYVRLVSKINCDIF